MGGRGTFKLFLRPERPLENNLYIQTCLGVLQRLEMTDMRKKLQDWVSKLPTHVGKFTAAEKELIREGSLEQGTWAKGTVSGLHLIAYGVGFRL